MAKIRLGCQTYTWQMSYEKYRGRLDHIIGVMAKAGFSGVEPEVCMLGKYDDPSLLAAELKKNNVELGALCYVADWRQPKETAEEKGEADKAMAFIKHFPGTMLALCQMPGKGRSNLKERQANVIACVNEVSRRAQGQGIACAFHPNSPPGSVFRTAEDYEVLMDGLDQSVVGFAPDVGHIANGGMDATAIMKKYRSVIRHVHFKDISRDGKWIEMGRGIIDFPGIVSHLRETGYDGWIMVEDESAKAESDPDAVTLENGTYVREKLLPLT